MSLAANKKKNHRSKSLSPASLNPYNQRTCKYHHGNRKMDTSSLSSYECTDCKSKIKRYGIVYGCSRCKFYLCCPCFRKPSCPNGHLLKAGHVNKNTLCSSCKYKCKKQRLQMYICNACRFNMCLGCYSYETCSGNHGLKWQKITATTHKSMHNCWKCQRIFKLNKSLFMCKKCKYSLCGDCYQPSLSLKSRIHRHHKINEQIKSDQNALLQQHLGAQTQQVKNDLNNNRPYIDDGDDEEEDEKKAIILNDDHLLDYNYIFNSLAPYGNGVNNNIKSKQKRKQSQTASERKNNKKKSKGKKKKQVNNGNTPSLSLSGTSEININMQYNDRELSSSLEFSGISGLESCAPSELTRIPSILTDCCICMERDKQVAFLPCGHYIACENCAKMLQNDTGMCAICSMKIQSILKIYE